MLFGGGWSCKAIQRPPRDVTARKTRSLPDGAGLTDLCVHGAFQFEDKALDIDLEP